MLAFRDVKKETFSYTSAEVRAQTQFVKEDMLKAKRNARKTSQNAQLPASGSGANIRSGRKRAGVKYPASRATVGLSDCPVQANTGIARAFGAALMDVKAERMPQLGDVVSVEWEDAWTEGGQYYTFESIADEESCICQSVGFLIRNDEVGITIAREGARDGRFRGVQHIPRSMVRLARVLN